MCCPRYHLRPRRRLYLQWSSPSKFGAIAVLGSDGRTPLGGRGRGVSCRWLCKQRHPGVSTWSQGLSTVVPWPAFPSPQRLQRPELARRHESRKKVSAHPTSELRQAAALRMLPDTGNNQVAEEKRCRVNADQAHSVITGVAPANLRKGSNK